MVKFSACVNIGYQALPHSVRSAVGVSGPWLVV